MINGHDDEPDLSFQNTAEWTLRAEMQEFVDSDRDSYFKNSKQKWFVDEYLGTVEMPFLCDENDKRNLPPLASFVVARNGQCFVEPVETRRMISLRPKNVYPGTPEIKIWIGSVTISDYNEVGVFSPYTAQYAEFLGHKGAGRGHNQLLIVGLADTLGYDTRWNTEMRSRQKMMSQEIVKAQRDKGITVKWRDEEERNAEICALIPLFLAAKIWPEQEKILQGSKWNNTAKYIAEFL